ncbi:MAG: hypothetical protein GTN89_13980 [Acidobacteria bacterium]|nr:hypothetical protein [Acidobacteriota bacterium]NIM60477.1 hypothetical protein [Acidobacteriota bacterium]NIO60374.1 hypothetical protein [Acidobacteriota bacterium]NIQ31446.1 hypothetical protein [Acidobacteriota bacterium]NIQ86690.1 hypothetical protein [Acidobacteriota bacterium]
MIPAARGLLVRGGRLMLELGAGQESDVRALVADAGFESLCIKPDLNGIPRLLTAVLR